MPEFSAAASSLQRLVRRRRHRAWYHEQTTMSDPLGQMDRAWKFWLVRAWMVVPMPVYLLSVMHTARPLDWRAPWIPSHDVSTGWVVFLFVATILSWADGWLLPFYSRARRQTEDRRRRWAGSAFGRFLVRAALFHGAGIYGVVLSFKTHDVRYAVVSLAMSAMMILLLPRPECTAPLNVAGTPRSPAGP